MLTESNLFEFAQKCARAYCARFKAWSRLDDAVGDACAYLLERKEKWSQPERTLKARVVGELTRLYQNEFGLRLKQPPKRASVDVEKLEDVAKENGATRGIRSDDSLLEIMRRALDQPDVAPYRDAIEDILCLDYSKKEIAEKHGLTQSQLSVVYKRYKNACRRLVPGRGVVIVDSSLDATEETPLFLLRKGAKK